MSFIVSSLAQHKNQAALIDDASGFWLSYAELREKIALVAERLSAFSRSLVLVPSANDIPSVIAYLASVEAGHAVMLVEPDLAAERLKTLSDAYHPELIVGKVDLGKRMAESLQSFSEISEGGNALGIWRRDAAAGLIHNDLCLLLPTSGSTGSPKMVRLSRRALEENTRAIAISQCLTSKERVLCHLSLHYSFGLSVVNSYLSVGASVVLSGKSLMSKDIWDFARCEAVTSFPGVPFHYDMLRRLDLERLNVPTLKTLMQAGGAMAAPMVGLFRDMMRKRGGRLFVMYGQTEAAPRLTTIDVTLPGSPLGSVGTALPGGRIEILDDGAQPLPAGVPGEIHYVGPNVMMGYALDRADIAKGDELRGRLMTGDLGSVDMDGNLTITGRTKRIGKLFGRRLNLDEVEAFARSLLHGQAIAVVEINEKLVIAVEKEEEIDKLRDELSVWLKIHPSALLVKKVDLLPRRSNGKIDYHRLESEI